MSRAVHREQLPGRWDPPALQGGDGAIVEGELVAVSRHLLSDVNGRKERYYVLYVRPSQLHRRRFDAQGNEREPNFSDTRKVNTGFLMSSFTRHTPSQTVAFWLLETELEKMELELGTQIRLKTQGDSPFIFSLAKLQGGTITKCNFAGDRQVGASWTDNIMANRAQGGPAPAPREQGDGAEEDEWPRSVDFSLGRLRAEGLQAAAADVCSPCSPCFNAVAPGGVQNGGGGGMDAGCTGPPQRRGPLCVLQRLLRVPVELSPCCVLLWAEAGTGDQAQSGQCWLCPHC
ncbi:arpin isoform X3 [Carettochelys insculpta]|uniref:arpin isoform X3 n=1 Tax=Carettochelys insculpta TaxID=44489 RepID=UPI003EBE5B26